MHSYLRWWQPSAAGKHAALPPFRTLRHRRRGVPALPQSLVNNGAVGSVLRNMPEQTAVIEKLTGPVGCSRTGASGIVSMLEILADRIAEHSVTLLRIAIGIVFFWFGALKLVPGGSPAEALAG